MTFCTKYIIRGGGGVNKWKWVCKISEKWSLPPAPTIRNLRVLKYINFEGIHFCNPNQGGLFRGLFCSAGRRGITASLSKTCQNYARNVSTHMQIVLESIPLNTKTPLILLVSAFFAKKSAFFWSKIVHLLKTIL